jgi:uncharacterized delta-60 repeat protein
MFNKRDIYLIFRALVFVVGAFLIASSSHMGLAQPISDDFDMGSYTIEDFADNVIYVPLVLTNFPLTPEPPMLDAIDNEDGDGNYTVFWSSSEGATSYTLEEATSSDFASPTTVYDGSGTSANISGRDVGTYYYRVMAANSYASSGWSNVKSADVTVPLPECPQIGPWNGETNQGSGYDVDFYVEDSPQCQVSDLSVEFKDSCGSGRTVVFESNPAITGSHFSITGGDIDEGVTTVGGDFSSPTTANGTFSYSRGSCTASGTWSADFNPGTNGIVYALAIQSDGKILVGGYFSWLRGEKRANLARLNADGSLDTGFDPDVGDGTVKALAVQSDGKIVVGGTFTELGGETRNFIGRLNADGTLDTAFDPGNYFTGLGWGVNAVVMQADGKIVAGGYFDGWTSQHSRENIVRLNTDGSVDTAYNPGAGSRVYTLALEEDGKILAGIYGYLNYQMRSPIYRISTDGTRSTLAYAEGSVTYTQVYALLVQSDGKILVGGSFSELDNADRDDIGRLNADGNLDTTFNPGASFWVYALAQQADNKLLVGGGFTTLGGAAQSRVGRLNLDGTPDATFNNPEASSTVYALAVQADGKIVVGGNFTTLGGETRQHIGRLNADGTLDTTFP